MKITVVMGFFLPMPPVAGGAIEKSWDRLARDIVQRGHEVTLISRQWPGWSHNETVNGVRYLRLPGFNHKRRLGLNLICDFIWSLRVYRKLPTADVIVLNTVSLACWLGAFKPRAGLVVAMLGRMPKGQFRLYRELARIFVPSTPVQTAVAKEAPRFSTLIRSIGYPINWSSLAAKHRRDPAIITIGYVGRLHEEKGLHLLTAALQRLAHENLPPWRALICGPADVARGGSGEAYRQRLENEAPPQVEFLAPQFDEAKLHAVYQQFDLFCYPSLADQGETFGVAVAEAMAAGAVPVVSDLPCFRDFVIPGETGLVFNATSSDAVDQLQRQLATLIRDTATRNRMAHAAQSSVRRYDYTRFADELLADFAQLTATAKPASSSA